MKTLHQINSSFFVFTLVLYLTLYFGLLAQIALGVVQLSIGFYLVIFRYNSIRHTGQIRLKIYWVIALLYVTSLFFVKRLDIESTTFWVFYLAICPMAIATYFTMLVHQLYKKTIVTPSIH